jgi:sugar lactone lactonase YvrE
MAEFERLVDGLGLAEGPCIDVEGALWFAGALSGGVHRRTPDGDVTTFDPGRRAIGGIVAHRAGGVVVAGADVRHVRPGREDRVLLGRRPGITGFNDLCTDADGAVLAGALRYRPMAGEEPEPGQVWRITDEEEAEPLATVGPWPNGMAVRDDGALLLADFALARVDLVRDGTPSPWAAAPDGSSCDGLALAADGAAWVALGQGAGIARFDAVGTLTEVLEVPAEFVSSLCFAGDDLIVTTGEAVLRTAAPAAGAPLTPATI